MVFAVGDNQALFTMLEYQAAGGSIRDAQNRPTLDAGSLGQVLSFYKNALDSGIIPSWSISFDSSSTWKTYQDQKANLVISWVTRYLSERPPDTSISVIPVPGQKTLTYATGWLWAIPSARPERRALATRLAEYLVDSQFLSQWSVAAGYLPTRPSALAAWTDQSLQALVSPIVLSAQARHSVDLLVILGPILRDAALSVFNGQADPTQAANQAAARLQAP
jgi:ABC-type glycerol-3-phosphate transport system substrate-binding protein